MGFSGSNERKRGGSRGLHLRPKTTYVLGGEKLAKKTVQKKEGREKRGWRTRQPENLRKKKGKRGGGK